MAKDTLRRQLSIVVVAFCLANGGKAGGGLKTWSFLFEFGEVYSLFTDCFHLEGGPSLPGLHEAEQGQAQTACSVQALAKSYSGASEPLPLQDIAPGVCKVKRGHCHL